MVSSGGLLPDSVAIHGNLVYVANSGNGGANYTGFRLGFTGHAQRVPGAEHNGGHLAVADLDRERIHRKPVLGGLINEYPRAA